MAHGKSVKVLITGFGPFPGVRSNPSGQLIKWIESGRYPVPAGVNISTAIIPTSWEAVREFADTRMVSGEHDIVLHFGVSARASGFQIETIARNTVTTAPDCDGLRCHSTCIEPHAPARLPVQFPAEPLACKLRQHSHPACVSHDAGRYLCNMLLYLSLKSANHRQAPTLQSFIHIPPLRAGQFDQEQLLAGLDVIIAHFAGLHRRAKAAASKNFN